MSAAPVHFPANEEWIELAGHPGYFISTRGRVYSTHSDKILSPYRADHGRNADGSWRVRVYANGRRHIVAVAYNVLLSFEGKPEGAWAPEYLDGDLLNVWLDNLRWKRWPVPERSPEELAGDRSSRVARFPCGAGSGSDVGERRAAPCSASP